MTRNLRKVAKREIKENKGDQKEKFTVIEAAMTITSCVVGAGIISVPYSMIVNGIWIGIGIHTFSIMMMVVCAYLYVTARDMFMIESFSDLCYLCFGR